MDHVFPHVAFIDMCRTTHPVRSSHSDLFWRCTLHAMAIQIMRLRGVPEDEANDVRELLDENNIEYYETPEGLFGMSMPAIWLPDKDQLELARSLLDEYQSERVSRARAERPRSMVDEIREHPLRLLAVLAGVGVVLYLSLMPFFTLGVKP